MTKVRHSTISADFDSNARTYAQRLASYITDASTVRAHTRRMFDWSPEIPEIKRMIADHAATKVPRFNNNIGQVGFNDDGSDWRPTGLVKPSEITGAVNKLEPLNLADFTREPATKPTTLREIIAAIAGYYWLSADDLIGTAREHRLVKARRTAMHVFHQRGNTYPVIGQFFGGRDHSTVIHACKQFEKLATEYDRAVAQRFYRETGE